MSEAERRERAETLAKFLAKQAHHDPDTPYLMGVSAQAHTPWGHGTLPDVQRIVPIWTTYYGLALSIIEREAARDG